jgi:hypothetical protein
VIVQSTTGSAQHLCTTLMGDPTGAHKRQTVAVAVQYLPQCRQGTNEGELSGRRSQGSPDCDREGMTDRKKRHFSEKPMIRGWAALLCPKVPQGPYSPARVFELQTPMALLDVDAHRALIPRNLAHRWHTKLSCSPPKPPVSDAGSLRAAQSTNPLAQIPTSGLGD